MRCAIHMPMNAEDLTIELMMVAYGNWQNAIKFARTNNSDLLRALETRLKSDRQSLALDNGSLKKSPARDPSIFHIYILLICKQLYTR